MGVLMRADEEFAKQAFDQSLESKGSSERIWPDGDEPSDFYLTADGEDFDVEIATLMEQVTIPEKILQKRELAILLKFWCKRLREKR